MFFVTKFLRKGNQLTSCTEIFFLFLYNKKYSALMRKTNEKKNIILASNKNVNNAKYQERLQYFYKRITLTHISRWDFLILNNWMSLLLIFISFFDDENHDMDSGIPSKAILFAIIWVIFRLMGYVILLWHSLSLQYNYFILYQCLRRLPC